MTTGHREVETKYDVDEATAIPELADLPDVVTVEGPRAFHLEAVYFDTADLALGRHGITLRRRSGGDDEGWHLKLPVDGARQEIHAPLGAGTRTPPAALRRIVRGVVRERTIGPVASVETERTTASLLDADEELLAEFCDDRVVARRLGAAGDEQRSWREWELEEHTARRRLTRAADARMRKAGARVAGHRSKFGRIMQVDVAVRDRQATRKHASEHELLGRHVSTVRAELHRLDPLARADVPDAVHQTRVACRTLRATLATFETSFDTSRTEPVREELQWLGDALGRPRDLEVLRARLGTLVRAESPSAVRGRPGPWIDAQLRTAHRAAHREALDAMTSDRYFALVDTLDSWRTDPPWADLRDRPATKRLPKA
ncbi:MAG TPA: CYTH and CHAD domain-containing protein, partial [Marmoricola sp.]